MRRLGRSWRTRASLLATAARSCSSLDILEELRSADLDIIPLGQAPSRLPRRSEPTVRAAIHHLLWSHDLHADLTQPLRP